LTLRGRTGGGLVASEDHATGAGLQHAGDGDLDGSVDVVAPAFDDNHRSVVEIADPLSRLFTLLDDVHVE
jgi:hypothetical protein